MRTRTLLIAAALGVASTASSALYGQPLVGSEMTYQGQLQENGVPFNGVADLYFGLYDSVEDGTFINSITKTSVPITNGLFNVTLNFGVSPFNGESRWMRIGVRYPATTGSWVFLIPRQQVTTVPYALHTRGLYCSNTGRLGIGTDTPLSSLHVGEIGDYYWGRGDGWGDFSLNNGTLGFSIGVATSGTGMGDVYLWPTGGTERLFLATPTDGQVLTMDHDRIGIGTVNPAKRLHVTGGNARFDGDVSLHTDAGVETVEMRAAEGSSDGGQVLLRTAAGATTIQIDGEYTAGGGGYIEVDGGREHPALSVGGTGSGRNDATLQVHNTQSNQGMAAYLTNNSDFATMHVENDGTGQTLWLVNGGGGDLIVARDATRSVFWVDGAGTTNARVLTIHGGADLAEGFDIGPAAAGNDAGRAPEAGMIASIDPAHPGRLIVSSEAYDRKVAGVISGAGGVDAGMVMGQAGSVADGAFPVALTGRVYCRADASTGPIVPGDLLTTSDTAGHAMKVTDFDRAPGAIIGKAMTPLPAGRGLVLVLVNLQ